MKRSTIVAASVLLGVVLLIFYKPRYKDIHKISSADSATIEFPSGTSGIIDIKPIRDILANAEWTDSSPINKGGYWMTIDSFPKIFVSEVNGCFWVTGYRGLFKVEEDHISTLYDYLESQSDVIRNRSRSQKESVEQVVAPDR